MFPPTPGHRLVNWIALSVAAIVIALTAVFAAGSLLSGGLLRLYTPREYCMDYDASVIWMHVVADGAIALAYYSIPVALLFFVRRRRDLSFSWMFVCFALFILACGTTHVMNIVAIWHAVYRLDGLIKFLTGVVSLGTAAMLWMLIPRALALPSPAALRAANAQLAEEIETRRAAEESLRELRNELERRVETRTAELSTANAQLREEIEARTRAERDREALLIRERNAREEAERASRAKDDFLATVSHELRTPLSAITGWVHVLQQPDVTGAEVAEGMAVIARNARTQAELIDDLLDMSRIIAGRLRLEVQPVELTAVIEAALETVEPAALAKEITVERRFDRIALPVTGDAGRLQQVVANLLNNAVKFTPRGGHVRIALERVDNDMQITVSDTGIGIPAEFIPQLFQPFQQADATTTRRHGGLGLGLAIVRHLVELHGGTISVRSPGEGQGATFTVRLPVRPARAELPSQKPATERPVVTRLEHRFDPMTVLLIEDEADSRDIIRRILQQGGATVVTAGGADEALQVLQEKRPTVIISDIGLPGQDGYTLIRRVRNLAPERGGLTPAVALTAFARTEDRMRALAAGYQMHLAKPVDPSELIVVLNSLVNRPTAFGA